MERLKSVIDKSLWKAFRHLRVLKYDMRPAWAPSIRSWTRLLHRPHLIFQAHVTFFFFFLTVSTVPSTSSLLFRPLSSKKKDTAKEFEIVYIDLILPTKNRPFALEKSANENNKYTNIIPGLVVYCSQ